MAKLPKPLLKGLRRKRQGPNVQPPADDQKHTATEIVPAHTRGIAEGLCPTCGTKTSPEKIQSITQYVEIINKHPFPFQDVRFCPKCLKMLYIEKEGETKNDENKERT